jgi:hypothetical protein
MHKTIVQVYLDLDDKIALAKYCTEKDISVSKFIATMIKNKVINIKRMESLKEKNKDKEG